MAIDKNDKRTMGFFVALEQDAQAVEWLMPTEYPDLTVYDEIAIDLECYDPDLTTKGPGWATNSGYPVGISVAAGDGKWYFPFAHQNGPNLERKFVLTWFGRMMKTPHITKIFHNAMYDLGWLWRMGVEVQGPIIDTMVVAALVDENRFSYSLNNLAKDYCGMRKDEKLLRAAARDWAVDAKAEMWRLPAHYVGTYAEQDAVATLHLWRALKAEVEKQSLQAILELEQATTPVLVKMRQMGVRVDLDKAEQAKAQLGQVAAQLRAEIKAASGVEVEPWAAGSVQQVFDALGLTYPTTERGAPSFTKAFMSAHPNETVNKIVQLREADKADSTFIESILSHAVNGRIHCEFHQLRSDDGGTVTGRLSCSTPNLQQIPARVPLLKKLIRGIFIPEEGCQWGSFDYSSQEPRLLTHYCAILSGPHRHPSIDQLVEDFRRGEGDLHQMTADLMGIKRKQAKGINLGIMYGMGVGKMAGELGVDMDEAKRLMNLHREKAPFVKGIAELATSQAERHGQIRTLGGRLCRFPLWESRSFGYTKPLPHDEAIKEYGPGIRRAFTYKALNRLIQGSAADQTKRAMVDCAAAGFQPMLQVHDELCFNIESASQAEQIREIMQEGFQLEVPNVVDVDLQSNWGDVE